MTAGGSPRLTRRVLLGAGVVAGGGTAAIALGDTQRGRRWLHGIGLVKGPDAEVPDSVATVTEHTRASPALGRPTSWAVSLPAGAVDAVVVCLHGRNEDHRFAFDAIGLHHFVSVAALPWAVVGVTAGPSSYWHPRRGGGDPLAMVFDEIVPSVAPGTGTHRIAVIGWSMGGFGALLAGRDRSEVDAVAAASPALWRRPADASAVAFDGPADFERHDLFTTPGRLRDIPVRIDCGDDDPFLPASRALADHVGAAGSFPPGFHEAATWRSFVAGQLAFLQTALAADRAP